MILFIWNIQNKQIHRKWLPRDGSSNRQRQKSSTGFLLGAVERLQNWIAVTAAQPCEILLQTTKSYI